MHRRHLLQRLDGEWYATIAAAAQEEAREIQAEAGRVRIHRSRRSGTQNTVDAARFEEELRAVLQGIVQRHLRNYRINADLQWQYVDLPQHRFHRAQFPFSAIY